MIHNKKSKYVLLSSGILLASMILTVTSIFSVYASSDAYDSGYDHGCADANIAPSERYINEARKGTSHHTDEFMDGYHDGFDDCSSRVGSYSQDTSDYPELKEGERYGACEERSVGLVCDIEDN
jgi:hypothetical protein